jgi:hypothetical protein
MEGDVEIPVTIKRMTEKAMLVETFDYKKRPLECWIPRSQIRETDCLAEGDEGTMTVSAWIAGEKGMVEKEEDDNPLRYSKKRGKK